MFGSPSGTLKIRLENRLVQDNGRGPENELDNPGKDANALVEFQIVGPTPPVDISFDPAPISYPNVPCSPNDCVFSPICLPPLPVDDPNAPQEDRIRITRTFEFDREDGQWVINGRLVDCSQFRFRVQRNTAERWILRNGRSWQHPIHIHLEEFRMIRRDEDDHRSSGGGGLIQCGSLEFGRKDVARLGEDEEIELIMRFRDFRGGWPMHCHNTVHEDHAMMLLWEVADTGDNKTEP
ncbi:MAG: multicopper oxidase domain-containing protein [Candidatus Acidiferrales bacterium]